MSWDIGYGDETSETIKLCKKKNFVIGEYSCQAPQNNPHNQQGQYKNMVGDMPDKWHGPFIGCHKRCKREFWGMGRFTKLGI